MIGYRAACAEFMEVLKENLIDIKGYCVKKSIEMAVKTKAV